MRAPTLAVLALTSLALTFAADFPEEDDVLVLDDSNFEDALKEFDPLLVEFYAPWCGHCKKLAPEYAQAAKSLKKDGLRIAKVDATAERDLASKFDVQGFPTLKFFRGGKATEYGGGRTKDSIVSWVTKKSGPPAKTISEAGELDNLIESNEVLVFGAFADADGAERKAFTAVASRMDDVTFVEAVGDAAAAVAGAQDVTAPAIVLFKDFDEGKVVYDGDLTEDADVETFVAGNRLPLVVEFSQQNAPKIFGGPVKTHMLFFADGDEEDTEGLLEGFRAPATQYRGSMLAVFVPKTEGRVMEYFGLSAKDLPTAVMVNMPEGAPMKKYMYTEEGVSGDNLQEFARKYFDGELKPFLKSEEVPASNDEPVKVVVGKNFDEFVFNEDKDVLVEFYAPWCGHCKALAPTYESLGEHFEGVDSVVIAKMDATANEVDHPDVQVRGFPTLKFFPGGKQNGKVVDFNGDRDLDAFVSFIKEQAGLPIDMPEEDDEL